jgi:Skp family chaperone for outer membrane proteins
MKFFLFLIISFSVFFSNITVSQSNDKIVFIDFEYLINNSDKGKLIFNDLNKMKQNNIKELELTQNELKNLENDIKLKKEIISKEELDKKVKIFNNNLKGLRDQKKKMEKELNEIKKKKMDEFVSQINSILEEYMKNNSIDIMFNNTNILIGKKSINKTDDILKLINEKIK